ncbi:hypothetical protein BT96DRAFT_389525 [Gymnopus androsaceus JB14]|uniref:Uncharacterized protein n=1 Tax=Gymnopus androsaceus JB14 TaxID=1447944 RepID=A0A6A4GVC1_9AGAR|nr:hypothetical protein BT96DRAFT_389525 [Gymnopus androsaceus JB14]
MSSSSLPSSLPPSPIAENGPAGSPFAPNLTSPPTYSSPPIPVPISATLQDVLNAASSLTTVVLEDWSPVRNPSPYDAFFISLSRNGEDDGMGLLTSGVSLPGTPAGSTFGTPGLGGMTPALGLNAESLNSLPPVPAIPQHLQRTTSQSHMVNSVINPLAGLPPHLANNPHIAAASAHLAAAGIHLPPGVLTPLYPSENGSAATLTQTQSPGPFSPGFGAPPLVTDTKFASALLSGENSAISSAGEGGRTPAAVNAALGVLGTYSFFLSLLDSNFFSYIGISNSQNILLPNLKTLTISNLSKNVIDLHLLAGMVESRWRGWLQTEQSQSSATTSAAVTSPSGSPSTTTSTPSFPLRAPSPSIISSLSLHTDLRLIKNKGSVGRIKALQKEAEQNAREGKGEKVKVYVSAKRRGGI